MTLRQINFVIGLLVGLALGWLLRTGGNGDDGNESKIVKVPKGYWDVEIAS